MIKLFTLLALMLSMAAAKAQTATFQYYYPGVAPLCGCPYNNWCANDITCGSFGCNFNPNTLDLAIVFSAMPPGGTIGSNPYKIQMELYLNGTQINSAFTYSSSPPYFAWMLYNTPVTSGQYQAKVLFQKFTVFGWVNVGTYWTNAINFNLCPPCVGNVTVGGSPLFTTPLTESQSWIQTSGSTIVPAGATVKFDAEPNSGYIALNPGFETQNGAVFTARALDGCGFQVPAKQAPIVDAPAPIMDAPLKIYPNPTSGLVTVRHPMGLPLLQVYDVAGTLRLAVKTSAAGKTELNISHLPAGIYYVRAEGQTPQKLVKQ